MNIGLPYMTQIRGGEDTGQRVGDAAQDGAKPETSSRSLGGWIALTFNQLVAALAAGFHKEHNTDDTHSGNMTLDGTPLGKWASVPLAQAAIAGTGAMTVTGVTITTLRYTIINRLMIVTFFFSGTVGGTPDTYITFAIPNARTAASAIFSACNVLDGATFQSGYCFTDASIPHNIRVIKQNQTPWTAGTATVWGQIAFEING